MTLAAECRFGMNDKLGMDDKAPAAAASKKCDSLPKQHPQPLVMFSPRGTGIELADITFHQCVKLGKFDTDRTISFVPPDGEFILMKYPAPLIITDFPK